ncbi:MULTISPECIES: SMI1/KNR4 family protein [unclassified Leptolyngbya]|uniref:SMI1/KNR4 family protein n=1 Tax=unclassified Leptolyngbya TaxID=2650499 RepID=UPI0016884F09|nr:MULTISPECIES: SMI1/KNR4 family protein [unclassified Leptolyngbya]MBD1912966.1 SMI1/KNR4 family protein [Leptolyngbya sp. FACHB-8]MBD2157970.1 SMI1/KNR4 family protein [Leptolyngbya sp. FACHB-16]
MYLEAAKARFQELEQLNKDIYKNRPCSLEEVELLENDLKLKLPDAYREFLLWCGNRCGFLDSDRYFWSDVKDSHREWFEEAMEEYNLPMTLISLDAIIFFAAHGGYIYAFIRASEGDNPPVHELRNGQLIWNHADSIEQFCLERIETALRLAKGR